MSNSTKLANPMKVITGKDTRWSYANVWEAKSINGGTPKFSVSLIIQSLSQLEALYSPSRAKTILNNCDHLLYLGGQDVETAAFIGKKANKPTSDILNMPLGSVWLFTRGQSPQQVRKYTPEEHPRYPAAG